MTERFIIARFSAIFIFTMEMKYKGTKSLKSAFKTEIFGITQVKTLHSVELYTHIVTDL